MDRPAREIAAEAVPVEQAPQGARRRPTHRDMPDRRGGDFFDRLDHAQGGSLGATEEGRPLRQDRPHLPHPARNRLKRLQASPPKGRGLPTSPIPPTPQEAGCRALAAPAAAADAWRSLMPDLTAHRHPVLAVPCPDCRAPIAVPRPAPGAAGRAATAPRRCTGHGARQRIAASSLPTAPRPRSGRISTPDAGRSRERRPASRPGHDARPAVHFHRGELTLRARPRHSS